MDESDNLENLISILKLQTYTNFELVVCVNQYDHWWLDETKKHICEDNRRSLEYLKIVNCFDISIIDKSSKGRGWLKKKGGVGWARKVLMDSISARASSTDIIVSIDADTYYPKNYLEQIMIFFEHNSKLFGLGLPYYHRLAKDETDRLILRYEIYMRYYMLNMLRIDNPFGFTALGSAMAFPVWAYTKVGGLTPVAAGEDFYFLQKLVKSGKIGIWTDTIAYPSPRLSDRVAFGTGPALIKGCSGNWSSYPIYNYKSFDDVHATFQSFSNLYKDNTDTPMDKFIEETFGSKNIWDPLRANYKDILNFEKACNNKVDGLRILQFLRWQDKENGSNDEKNLFDFLKKFHRNEMDDKLIDKFHKFDYQESELDTLTKIRDLLFNIEMRVRKKLHVENT